MCGIAGIIVRDGSGPRDLSQAIALMEHRGPDGHGQWRERWSDAHSVTFAHRRLSIIDLSDAGRQPMADVTGRYVLTFNGEIYNYLELRSELKADGAEFRTASDSEVILEAYKAWGTACLDRFNGMFAFAIWDTRDHALFAARDRYGEKPLLYAAKPGFFAFASEYKVLLTLPGVGRGYDALRLLRFAADPGQGCDADRQTVFDDICQLLPGEALQIAADEARPRVWRYYTPVFDPSRAGKSEADLFAEFREILIDSVRIRMRSDVKVGSCLSGGLDFECYRLHRPPSARRRCALSHVHRPVSRHRRRRGAFRQNRRRRHPCRKPSRRADSRSLRRRTAAVHVAERVAGRRRQPVRAVVCVPLGQAARRHSFA